MHDTDHAAAILRIRVRVPTSGMPPTRERRRRAEPILPPQRAVSIAAIRPEIVFPRADIHADQPGAPPPFQNSEAAAIAAAAAAFPTEWTLEIVGFGGGERAERLNGRYSLRLVAGDHEQVCWVGGGDGATATRVELTARPIECGEWRLRFLLGDGEVIYSKAASDWNHIGANVLTDREARGCFVSAVIPYSAAVVPS